jgi:CTP synthase (UTP-ammonia lyase)
MKPKLALVGDYSSEVIAHRAIPRALELACAGKQRNLTWQWVATRDLRNAARDLAKFSAVWLVPASPYENMAGALEAVRFARETNRPFLGTCGGFQHALIEFARNVAGLTTADHAETNPHGTTLVIAPLACSLVEQTGALRFAPGSLLRAAYGRETAQEGYHCSYGLNPAHRAQLERAGLRFTAFDENDEVRAAELPVSLHPFFVGTLFQPERAALREVLPPLVAAFVRAAARA